MKNKAAKKRKLQSYYCAASQKIDGWANQRQPGQISKSQHDNPDGNVATVGMNSSRKALRDLFLEVPEYYHIEVVEAIMNAIKEGKPIIFYLKKDAYKCAHDPIIRRGRPQKLKSAVSVAMEQISGEATAQQIIEWVYMRRERPSSKKRSAEIEINRKKAQEYIPDDFTERQITVKRPIEQPKFPPSRKKCPRCGAPLTINDGGYGTYFECGVCGYIGAN